MSSFSKKGSAELWIDAVYIILWIVFLFGLGTSTVPMNMRFWHFLTNACHTVAQTFGRWGIHAETAYWKAVEAQRG